MDATLTDIKLEYQALWIQVAVYFFITCLVYNYQIKLSHHHANEQLRKLKRKATHAKEMKLKALAKASTQ